MTYGLILHGLSGDTPPSLLEILTGSASATIFFPLLTSFQALQLVEFHSRWDKKVSFVEKFGVAAYPRVTSGLAWERDIKST